MTPIAFACAQRDVGPVIALIELGIDCAGPCLLHQRTPIEVAVMHENQEIVDVLTSAIGQCLALQTAAARGDVGEIRRLVHREHVGMILNGVHAADMAEEESEAASWMRGTWTRMMAKGGPRQFNEYNARQCERLRWMILRKRGCVTNDRLLDWFLGSQRALEEGMAGPCPDDVCGEILEYWC